MANVDLLIKNKKKQTLLIWRDDKYYGPGWHIPGGIIRFKETFSSRIHKVAESELGMSVSHTKDPITIKELFAKNRDVRGHFITFLYECCPKSEPDISRKYNGVNPKMVNGLGMINLQKTLSNNMPPMRHSLMEIIMIKYDIESDLNFIFNKCKYEFDLLTNKSILITGGTGFFGKWFLELIFYANKNYNTNILTTLITRDQNKFLLENPHFQK